MVLSSLDPGGLHASRQEASAKFIFCNSRARRNDESYSEDSDAAGMGRLSVRAWKVEKLGASHHRHC